MRFRRGCLAGHHLFQQFRSAIPSSGRVWNDTGQRWARQVANDGIIIHADDCDLFGHHDFEFPASVQYLPCTDVVTSHQSRRLCEAANPIGKSPIFARPRVASRFLPHGIEDFATQSEQSQSFDKMIAPPDRPIEAGSSVESQISKTAFQQMFCGQLSDALVVRFNPWDPRQLPCGTHIDNGNSNAVNDPGNFFRLDPSDQSVALPIANPFRRCRAPILFGQVDTPRIVLLLVSDDALKQTARVGVRRFD